MPSTHEISKAITELLISPIKADQAAISRLEKQIGVPVEVIIKQLDDVGYLEEAYVEEKPLRSIPSKIYHPGRLVACGLLGASLTGVVFLALNSDSISVAISLGFTGGAALAKVSEY